MSENNLDGVIRPDADIQADLDLWFSENHQKAGRATAASCFKELMPDAFSNPADTAAELYKAITAEQTIIGILAYDESDPSHPLSRFLLNMMYHLDNDKYKDLCSCWENSALRRHMHDFEHFPWLDTLKKYTITDGSVFVDFKNCIHTKNPDVTMPSASASQPHTLHWDFRYSINYHTCPQIIGIVRYKKFFRITQMQII